MKPAARFEKRDILYRVADSAGMLRRNIMPRAFGAPLNNASILFADIKQATMLTPRSSSGGSSKCFAVDLWCARDARYFAAPTVMKSLYRAKQTYGVGRLACAPISSGRPSTFGIANETRYLRPIFASLLLCGVVDAHDVYRRRAVIRRRSSMADWAGIQHYFCRQLLPHIILTWHDVRAEGN